MALSLRFEIPFGAFCSMINYFVMDVCPLYHHVHQL